MIKIEKFEDRNIVRVTPLGRLEKPDFKRLNTFLDEYINGHDRIPSLVIHADKFPAWKKFGAFLAHIKFVKNAARNSSVKTVCFPIVNKVKWETRGNK